ncbi:MAG: DUF1800 domain-containing protein [Bacteroidota bacterium]
MLKLTFQMAMLLLFGSVITSQSRPIEVLNSLDLPYADAGLTEAQAAAHLLDRLAYGARPGEVEQVVAQGIENWVLDQLYPDQEPELNDALNAQFPALAMPVEEIGQTYPAPGVRLIFAPLHLGEGNNGRGQTSNGRRPFRGNRSQLRSNRNRMRQSVTPGRNRMGRDSMNAQSGNRQSDLKTRILNAEPAPTNPTGRMGPLAELSERLGWRPLEDLTYQLMAQKLARALYSENQLAETLTDFWFNHFNVSIANANEDTPHVLAYERDAIRPYVLGNFRELLGATAKHPAMLFYLDNHNSNAAEDATPLVAPRQNRQNPLSNNPQLQQFAPRFGVNENYARELFELHTLGVDGGYTQKDIEEAARVFTGWKAAPTLLPLTEEQLTRLPRILNRQSKAIFENGFYFNPTRHDADEKIVLGERFRTGGGIEEGERILDLLAVHPSTARHLSRKLAERYLNDSPPSDLIEAMATDFISSGGDLRQLLIRLLESAAFWQSRGQKIKTPFEYIASSLRSLDAQVDDLRPLLRWSTRMGQPLYAYQAPTGYPDYATHWTNGAALLNRMNFGLALAQGQIAGTSYQALALNQNREPESQEAALSRYLEILLPQRTTTETQELLLPVMRDPAFADKVAQAAGEESLPLNETDNPNSTSLTQVIGLILGAPEFQRQ